MVLAVGANTKETHMSHHKAHSHDANTPSSVAGHRAAIRSLADAHARISRYDDDCRDYLDPKNPSWGPDVYAYRAGALVRLLYSLIYHMRLRPELMEAVEDAWFNGGFVWRRLEEDLQALGF